MKVVGNRSDDPSGHALPFLILEIWISVLPMYLRAPVKGKRVLIVDDVITAGTAIRQAMKILTEAGATAAGVVIALDRAELFAGEVTAVEALASDLGVPIVSIASVADIIEHVADASLRQRMLEYQQRYCRVA